MLRSDDIGGFEYELIWQKQDDGTLLNTHQRRQKSEPDDATWEILYEWVYVKNLNREIFPEDDDEDIE